MQLIIRKGAETGGATGIGKICTDRSVKQQRSANCLRIPANTISFLNKLRKVRRSGVISRSLVRCCRYESSLKHFIFCLFVSSEKLQDADFRGSAPFLGQTAGNFRVTLPQTLVI